MSATVPRVLRIGPEDSGAFWDAIAEAVLDVPISGVRDIHPNGFSCEVETWLAIHQRTTPAVTVWHYEHTLDAPRLLTAYPIR